MKQFVGFETKFKVKMFKKLTSAVLCEGDDDDL
jgi:hypothetical protein